MSELENRPTWVFWSCEHLSEEWSALITPEITTPSPGGTSSPRRSTGNLFRLADVWNRVRRHDRLSETRSKTGGMTVRALPSPFSIRMMSMANRATGGLAGRLAGR